MKSILMTVLCLSAVGVTSFAQSAEGVINKMDELQTFDTMYAEGTMITVDRFGEKRSTYKSWSRGSEDFLIEFTNIEEKGQKVLRVDEELYLFYPDAEDIIPMHGAALKQSMFGDISYEDITEGSNTLDKYDVEMMGSEFVKGVDCWVIEMIATSRNVPYPKQVVKVGKDDYVLREAEYYARSGRLLKTVDVVESRVFDDGRIILTEMVMEDQLRRGSSTTMRIDTLEIDPDLDDDLFSLRSLY
ncbi:MAG: outer membrane lipoprotein-sorting protein [Spirochaetaceae bacterium]|nr:outer membrane lipoprotein-sorting protein [Spirochaetaceae bacterium]MDT8297159.1 outer membrane lipoprotein-sorting protein [Spirochaetaceae bacterium]